MGLPMPNCTEKAETKKIELKKAVKPEKVVQVFAVVEILACVMPTHLELLRSDKKAVETRVNIGSQPFLW